jgi:membrane-anchored mycosin MYCP
VRVGSPSAMRVLRLRDGIRYVEPLARRARTETAVGLQPAFADEWQWRATGQDLVPDWVRQAAASVTVAVIDTGADLTAPSIAGKGPTAWNVVTGKPVVTDSVGHGTFVASLAGGATDPETGMAGFGGEAKLMIVQANRGGSGFSDVDEASAIVWAVDHGARILNLSLGGGETSAVERAAIRYAVTHGALLVAAAGNTAQSGNAPTYPAALLGRRGLVVGAATNAGKRAAFSSTGRYVDVLAPGVNVLGALSAGRRTALFTAGPSDAYGYASGTSYAAPEVAGAAALVWAANPLLDAGAVAALLSGTASGGGVWSSNLAFGNVDIAAAVRRAIAGDVPQLVYPGERAR